MCYYNYWFRFVFLVVLFDFETLASWLNVCAIDRTFIGSIEVKLCVPLVFLNYIKWLLFAITVIKNLFKLMRNIRKHTHTLEKREHTHAQPHNRLSKNASTDWKWKEKEGRYARAMCKQVPEPLRVDSTRERVRAWESKRHSRAWCTCVYVLPEMLMSVNSALLTTVAVGLSLLLAIACCLHVEHRVPINLMNGTSLEKWPWANAKCGQAYCNWTVIFSCGCTWNINGKEMEMLT